MINKILVIVGLVVAACLQLVLAHPGEVHVPLPRAELERRRLEAERRHTLARRCAPQLAEFHAKRKAKRSAVFGPRHINDERFGRRQDDVKPLHPPTFAAIQNSTCVTAPEVTEGPYYVANELLRTDVRGDQTGVDLTIDIGVMDTRTCTPLTDALVEIWACNATGAYSGFTTAVLGAGNAMSDQNTWLRGGYATNAEGVVEFKTIYPGYYSGRTIHVHTMVQTNYSVATNGSIISHAGQVRHVGQIYFSEDLNNQVVSQPAYQNTRHTRTLNANDGLLAQGSANGYNAVAATQLLGDNIANGVLAYITLGVDTQFQGSIRTNNYVTPSAAGGAAAATAPASNGAVRLRAPLLKYFF